jgi:hypothetical protein
LTLFVIEFELRVKLNLRVELIKPEAAMECRPDGYFDFQLIT